MASVAGGGGAANGLSRGGSLSAAELSAAGADQEMWEALQALTDLKQAC